MGFTLPGSNLILSHYPSPVLSTHLLLFTLTLLLSCLSLSLMICDCVKPSKSQENLSILRFLTLSHMWNSFFFMQVNLFMGFQNQYSVYHNAESCLLSMGKENCRMSFSIWWTRKTLVREDLIRKQKLILFIPWRLCVC